MPDAEPNRSVQLRQTRLSLVIACFLITLGCTETTTTPPAQNGSLLKPAPGTITEFQPENNNRIVDPKVPVTDPLSGPLAVLKNAQRQLPTLAIEHALNLFNATEGRYPDSFQEFMDRIITENRIALPQLPAGLEYQYDVTNHQLVVVSTKPAADKTAP